MKIRAITVIWGAPFVDMYLRVALRSLLAQGNLCDLARAHRVLYVIYTTPEDARAIEAAPAFRKLREAVEVRITLFSPTEIDTANFGSHNDLWRRGVDLARRNRETLFFLIPDVVYAKGTLVDWAGRMAGGCRALYTPGPQVVLETILPELEAAAAGSDVLSLERDRVPALLLRHMHPMHCGMMRDAPRRVPFAEYDIRGVAGRGIVLRELSAQPFCLDPSHFERLVNFSPTDHLDDVATVPCSVLSVEPLFKRVEWYYRPWRLDGTRLSQLGAWWDFFGPPGCVKDSATPHGFRLIEDAAWNAQLAFADAGGRMFRAQLIVATRIYRLIVGLRRLGLERSPEVIAAALFAADLRRRVIVRPGATILVPADSAYGEEERLALRNCLVPGREGDLLDLVRDHVVPPRCRGAAPGAVVSARGQPLPPIAARAGIVAGPVCIEGYQIYVIDRVLLRGGVGTPAAQTPVAAPPAAHAALYPGELGAAHPRRALVGAFGYPAWAEGGMARRLLYLAMHVPLLEAVIALPLLAARGRFRPELGAALRRLLGLVERSPRIGRAARLARGTYSAGGARAVRAALLLAAARILRMPRIVAAMRRLRARGAGLARRASIVARVVGFGAAGRVAIAWLGRRVAALRWLSRAAPEAAAAEFGEVRLARGLLAMEHGYAHYQAAALPLEVAPAPLELVRSCLAKSGLNADNAGPLLESSMEALLQSHPRWLECWLELGYLKQDQGRPQEALQCYLRAANGVSLSGPGERDPRAAALASAARLLRAEGHLAEAAKNYAAALAIDPGQHAVTVEYARVRRELGCAEESLGLFLAGIHHEETSSNVPKTSRDAAELLLPRLARRAAGGVRSAASYHVRQ